MPFSEQLSCKISVIFHKINHMKTKRIIYWIATGLLSLLLCYSLYMYIFTTEVIKETMETFSYPPYLVYFLTVAKALGLIVLLSDIKGIIKEWAYAGFFFNFLLAFIAHYMVGDGEGAGAAIALFLLAISYFTGKQVRPWIIRK